MVKREQQIGYVLLGLGGLLLLTNLSGGDTGWLWLAALAAVFLTGYRRRREPGLLVPGGVLGGIAVGILLEEVVGLDGSFLVGLAGGFYAMRALEPRVHAWAIWPAGVLAAVAALSFVSSNAWVVALLLLLGGLALLGRERSGQTAKPAPATPDDANARLTRLAAWRARRAAEANMVPTDFMGNDQLERIARERPASLEALGRILEPAQLERYGAEVLEALG